MGEMVDFKSNGDTARGYLAVPSGGSGSGVIVVQEWWGLNPQIKGVADRLAGEGFVALAPDLYRGELAGHDEMDKAGQLMSSLPMDRAARDMTGAVDFLTGHSSVKGDGVGAIGFCMGGGLVLVLGTLRPDRVKAIVPFYGVVGIDDAAPDWSKLDAAVEGHYAENDDFFPASKAKALEAGLRGLGKDCTFHVYPGTGHAFANETNAIGTYHADAASTAWDRAVVFLHSQLG
ncbi:MAG TPA: dienelactone hydrolase family protein [Acidimicrobiales bacterium]|jgi:carboxymethylenebutenolidase|nr:dienelactone hydrolase family protein [Acidimicrobiales bacterium]